MEKDSEIDVEYGDDPAIAPKSEARSYYIGLLFLGLGVGLGCINLLPSNSFLFLTSIQLLAFLFLGIFYTLFMNTGPRMATQGKLIYTVLLTLLMYAALVLLYAYYKKSLPLLALSSSSAFLLPFLIRESWYFYLHITRSEYEPGDKNIRVVMEKETYDRNTLFERESLRLQNIYKEKLQDELSLISEKEKQKYHAELTMAEEKLNAQQKIFYEKMLQTKMDEFRASEMEMYAAKLKDVSHNLEKEKENYQQENSTQTKFINQLKEENYQRLSCSKEDLQRLQTSIQQQLHIQQTEFVAEKEALEKRYKEELEALRNAYDSLEQKMTHAREIALLEQSEIYQHNLNEEVKKSKSEKKVYQLELMKERDALIEENRLLHNSKLASALEENLSQKERYEKRLMEVNNKISLEEKEIYELKLNEKILELNSKHQAHIEQLEKKLSSSNTLRNNGSEVLIDLVESESVNNDTLEQLGPLTQKHPPYTIENSIAEEVTKPSIGKPGKTWFYSKPEVEPKPVVFLNSVQLYVQLSMNIGGAEEIFTVSTSLEISLNEFFNHFINLKSRKYQVDLFDDKGNSYPWKFYTKGMMGSKELDPLLSLHKNKVKELSVIVARRI
ncbi:MAG: hypothetical protein ABIN94_01005 [Ferruginibacter sp.]